MNIRTTTLILASAALMAGCSQTMASRLAPSSMVTQASAPAPVQLDADQLKTADDPVCERIYSDYRVASAGFAAEPPKKKRSLLKRFGGAAIGVATSAAGIGGVDSTVVSAGRAAENAVNISNAKDDFEEGMGVMSRAGSLLELNRMTLHTAQANGCPLEPIFPDAS